MSFISNRLQRRKKSQRTAKTDPKIGPVLTGPENSDSKIPLCVFTQRGIFYLPILLSGIPHIRQETAARQIAVPRQIDEPRLVFLIHTVGNCIGRNGQMLLMRESEGFICTDQRRYFPGRTDLNHFSPEIWFPSRSRFQRNQVRPRVLLRCI